MNVLQTSGLSKRFGRVEAVRHLDLAIPGGSVFGILGPNGSGKTTTLGIVLGSVLADSGTFAWFGGVALHLARRRIGALLEGPAFYPSLSAEQNLAIVARIKHVDVGAIAPALDRAGLSDRRGSAVQTFSPGMRQRLGLAAALLGDPAVLVLDEPSNGLDPHGIADLRAIIRTAAGDGTTVIVASHVLAEIERLCTHVAIMAAGRLVACGEMGSILSGTGHTGLEAAFLALARNHGGS